MHIERNVGFYNMGMLTVSVFTLMFCCDSVNAEVNSQTLESVATPAGISEGVAEIKTGKNPRYIYGNLAESDIIYIANEDSGTISLLNTTTNTVMKNILVGDNPGFIYGGGYGIYVANKLDDSVSVINKNSNRVTNIPVGKTPYFIYGNPGLNTIYVANFGDDSVSVINPVSHKVTNIPVGKSPNFIYGAFIYKDKDVLEYPPLVLDKIYVANFGDDSVSVIDPVSHKVTNIPVGKSPNFIYGDPTSNKIYVANSGSDSVSVIDQTSNQPVTNIAVGKYPQFIYGDQSVGEFGDTYLDKMYVANTDSDSVSVIDPVSHKVTNIPVGKSPNFIYGDPTSNKIYVANTGSDSVSVIDQTSNRRLYDIPVGRNPLYIFGDTFHLDTLYVANSGSNDLSVVTGGISLINIKTDKVVAGVTFDKSPFDGGRVICNTNPRDLEAPTNRLIYVSSGTGCIAEPSKGFEFSSWTEVSSDNSTRTITATSGSPWAALLDTFNLKPTDPAANLTVNHFGNFTAYFRVLPAPLPAEYWASLFTVVATAIVGSLLIPAVMGWTKSKRQTYRLNSFHKQMALAYEDNRLDEKDIPTLNTLHKGISDSYAAGKINNEQYTNLKNEVSIAYEEIFKWKIDSQGKSSYAIMNREGDLKEGALMEIKEEISDAYSKGKITELHYDLLNEKISKMTQEKD